MNPPSPHKTDARVSAWLVALLMVLATVGLLLSPVPTGWLGVWQNQLLDFGHVPLFAVLVLALRFGTGPPVRWPFLAALALAGLAELVQPLVGRTGDGLDFLRGALGACTAASAVRAWELRRSRRRAVAYLILAGAWVAWPVVEVAPYLADTVAGRRAFPTLATFSTDQELRRWECDQATITRAGSGCVVEFRTGPAEYPGIALRPVVTDFRGYRWLCYEFQVAGVPLSLVTSVRTGTNHSDATTHTDIERQYAVGTHVARLDLAEMAARGRPELLDLSDVRSVILFVIRPPEPRTIVLTRVWLEP